MSAEIKNSYSCLSKDSFLSGAHFLYRKFIEPKSSDEDSKRRELILNILLLCIIVLFGIGFSIAAYNASVNKSYTGIPLSIFFMIFCYFVFLYSLSRFNLFILSAYLFVAALSVLIFDGFLKTGIDTPSGLLFSVLTIVISSILIGTKFAFIITILISSAIAVIGYLQINESISISIPWALQVHNELDVFLYVVIFFIIATVSWLSNREIEKSLKRARKSEAELKQERDFLEIKVKERTDELQKTQAERITQLYKFAEMGRLSSGLFHDLVNPITAISLNVKSIGRGSVNEKIYLQNAVYALRQLEKYVLAAKNQITGRENKQVFSPKKEIEQVIKILSYKSRQANLKIDLFAPKDILFFGSASKFSQVATNLISNAIDASAITPYKNSRNKIKIFLFRKNDIIKFSVRDFGTGIAKENFDKIFEPFFTTKESSGGTGIGLYLIKNIIEKDFSGKIYFKTEAEKGTKFTVVFPACYKTKS